MRQRCRRAVAHGQSGGLPVDEHVVALAAEQRASAPPLSAGCSFPPLVYRDVAQHEHKLVGDLHGSSGSSTSSGPYRPKPTWAADITCG